MQLLADPHASVNQIAKFYRVSTHTVRAIRTREAKTIADLKQRLSSIFGNVVEMSAERMEELCGKANLRDAGISAGIATDKVLALTGQMPAVNIANIWVPSESLHENAIVPRFLAPIQIGRTALNYFSVISRMFLLPMISRISRRFVCVASC